MRPSAGAGWRTSSSSSACWPIPARRSSKCFLHIGKEEQRRRLQERIDDPDKHWKFNPQDLESAKLWDQYQDAYEELLGRTGTTHAPWYIVPSDSKTHRNLMVTEILLATLAQAGTVVPAGAADAGRAEGGLRRPRAGLRRAGAHRAQLLLDHQAFFGGAKRQADRQRPHRAGASQTSSEVFAILLVPLELHGFRSVPAGRARDSFALRLEPVDRKLPPGPRPPVRCSARADRRGGARASCISRLSRSCICGRVGAEAPVWLKVTRWPPSRTRHCAAGGGSTVA